MIAMILTQGIFAKVLRNAPADRTEFFYKPFCDACDEFDISTAERVAAFLAQCAHESGEFRYMKELASGSAYEFRSDLGNTQSGDGPKYKGRGPLQITGRVNYTACGIALGLDLVAHPELLEHATEGCRSAGWFWTTRKLNSLADKGEFDIITRRINGGSTGSAQRRLYHQRALNLLA